MSPQRSSSPSEHDQASPPGRRFSPLALLGGLLGPIRQQPVRAVLAAVIVVGALGGIGFGAWLMVKLRGPDPNLPTLATALSELDAGHYAEAQQIAQRLLANEHLGYEERGGPMFVLGMAAFREAEQAAISEERRHLNLVAARYLAESRERAFPAEREAEGLYLLARAEFRSGRYGPSVASLQAALEANPQRKAELLSLLAKACLRAPKPRPAEALKYNEQYLADERATGAQLNAALLERAQIQLQLSELDACASTLDTLDSASTLGPAVTIMRGRLLMRKAEQALTAQGTVGDDAAALYREAVKLFKQLPERSAADDPTPRQAQYLLGLCLAKLDDERGAEAAFARASRLKRGTPEALASALEEADLQRKEGRREAALAGYLKVLEEAGDGAGYQNEWLPLEQLRGRIEAAIEDYRDKQEFQTATSLTEALHPLFTRQRALELSGEVEAAWGQALLKQAERASAAEATKLTPEGRAKCRDAGVTFSRLAEMRKAAREYPDDLWRSAMNYLAGQDYRHALQQLKQYVSQESRKRRSESLVALGQCYLAVQKLDLALPPLLECIEHFRKHPDSYRARLLASHVYFENGRFAEAKSLLVDNLENELLAPSSLEWRDSIFALGKLLHREATDLESQSLKGGVDSPYPEVVNVALKDLEKSFNAYQEAAERLSEAVQRYPDAPGALESRYMIAQSHQQSAKWPRKLRGTLAVETTRAALQRQAQDELNAALAEYDPLLALLAERQEKDGLTEVEALMMRNCYFARADVLFDLERFEDAIAAYSSATNRYHDRPESLEAFVQIASCYRRMNRPAEARGTLEQAKVVLRRIPADAAFTRTTRYDRGEWVQLLNWLGSL